MPLAPVTDAIMPTTPAQPASFASTICNGCRNQSRQRTGGGIGRISAAALETLKRSERPSGVSSLSVGTMRASAPPLERRVATSASSLDEEIVVVVSVCCPTEVEVRAISNTRTGRPVGVVSAIRRANRYG